MKFFKTFIEKVTEAQSRRQMTGQCLSIEDTHKNANFPKTDVQSMQPLQRSNRLLGGTWQTDSKIYIKEQRTENIPRPQQRPERRLALPNVRTSQETENTQPRLSNNWPQTRWGRFPTWGRTIPINGSQTWLHRRLIWNTSKTQMWHCMPIKSQCPGVGARKRL